MLFYVLSMQHLPGYALLFKPLADLRKQGLQYLHTWAAGDFSLWGSKQYSKLTITPGTKLFMRHAQLMPHTDILFNGVSGDPHHSVDRFDPCTLTVQTDDLS